MRYAGIKIPISSVAKNTQLALGIAAREIASQGFSKTSVGLRQMLSIMTTTTFIAIHVRVKTTKAFAEVESDSSDNSEDSTRLYCNHLTPMPSVPMT